MVITAPHPGSGSTNTRGSAPDRTQDRSQSGLPLAPFFDLSSDLMGIAHASTGRWDWTNAAFLSHLGYTASELQGVRVSSLVHPEDLSHCERAARALAEGHRVSFTGRMRAKSGNHLAITWALEPKLEEGVVYCIGRPVTHSAKPQTSENAIRALDAAHAFTFSWIRGSDQLHLDAAADAVLGTSPGELTTGQDYLARIAPEDVEHLRETIAAATRAAPDFEACYRIRDAEGRVKWIEEAGRVHIAESGRKTGITGLCRDVTARKRAEEATELVMNEMTHRAKNILSVVQAVLQFTKADTVEAYAAAIRSRVQSLARTQGLLAAEQWTGADLASIIAAEFEPFGGPDESRLTADGPPVRIAAHAVQTITLVIHELATNAAKHGALSVPAGHIKLTWTLEGGFLALVWRETGGPTVAPPARKGFGHVLITASLNHIGGESDLDFRPEGLVCRLLIPGAALTRPKAR